MKPAPYARVQHGGANRSSVSPRIVLVLLVACAVALGGCSTVKNVFTSRKDRALKPAELAVITPSVSVTRLWSAKAGKGEGLIDARQPASAITLSPSSRSAGRCSRATSYVSSPVRSGGAGTPTCSGSSPG